MTSNASRRGSHRHQRRANKHLRRLRDDPFFPVLVDFKRFLGGPCVPANGLRPAGGDPFDAFAGVNVSSIVLALPIVTLTGAATSDTGIIKA